VEPRLTASLQLRHRSEMTLGFSDPRSPASFVPDEPVASVSSRDAPWTFRRYRPGTRVLILPLTLSVAPTLFEA
jgi:hypothetical protein